MSYFQQLEENQWAYLDLEGIFGSIICDANIVIALTGALNNQHASPWPSPVPTIKMDLPISKIPTRIMELGYALTGLSQ